MAKSRSSKRVGLGQHKKELTLPEGLIKNNYVPRWINDEGDRLRQAQESGWEFVLNEKGVHVGEDVETGNSDLGSRVSKVVDKAARKVGEPMRAYLMQIKREWYEEDQKEKIKRVESVDRQIKLGDQGIQDGDDSFYRKMDYKT